MLHHCAHTKPHRVLPFEPQFISPPHKFHYLFFLMDGRQSMCLTEKLTFPLWGFTFLTFLLKTTAAHFKPFHIWRRGERETQSRNKKTPWGDCALCILNFTPTCHWTCSSLIRPFHTQGANNRPFVMGLQVRLHWCWEQNVVSLIHLSSNFQVTSRLEIRTTHKRNRQMCKHMQMIKATQLLILQKRVQHVYVLNTWKAVTWGMTS